MEKKDYRTQNKAGEVVPMPEKFAVISDKNYKNALGLLPEGAAYLYPIAEEWVFNSGCVLIDGRPVTEAKLKAFYQQIIPESIDLTLLRVLYCIMLDSPSDGLIVYLPDLCRFMGKQTVSANEIAGIENSLNAFTKMLGVIDGMVFPVLSGVTLDHDKNTLSFASPYLSKVIECMHGKHSYLIKPSIRNERNKRAVEMVHIITVLIEEAGNRTAHIKGINLVKRNPLLLEALNKAAPADKNKLLARTFSKTWELLKSQTFLEQTYKNIQLPDTKDIPTMSTLNKVYEFRHEGKKSRRDAL